MKSTSSGNGLRSVLAIACDAPVGDEPAADLGLDLLAEMGDPGLVLVAA